jgi:hypothetical protein
VRSKAIKAVAAAAARLSVRHTRTWWVPANLDAIVTQHAMSASGRKIDVTAFPAPMHRRPSTHQPNKK